MSDVWNQIPSGTPEGPPSQIKPFPTVFVAALCGLLVVASFAAGILAERFVIEGGTGRDISGPPIAQIQQLLEDESYYWPEDSQEQDDLLTAIDYGSLRGGLQSASDLGLLDPYTAYLPPEQAEQVQQQLDGEYEGIGVYIDLIENALTIVSPMPGSPAEEVGLLPGDVLTAVDGTSLEGMTIKDAQTLVQGPEGTTVELTLARPGQADPFNVTVERRRIDTPVVDYELDEDSGVAVISVSIFNDKTTAQLDTALNQALADEAVGIVLDLRFNGGGWVTAAQEMIGRFVPDDSGVALYEDDDQAEDNELVEVPIIGGGPEIFDLPLTVLVNDGTASAAEIVAGALKDYDRAQIVGVTTFGKGSVQRVHEFEDNSSLRITIALWLTPDKTVIDKAGIVPNVEVQRPENTPEDQDPQLDRAIQVTIGQ